MIVLQDAIKEVQDLLADQEEQIESIMGSSFDTGTDVEFHPLVLEIAKLLKDNTILLVPTYEFIRSKLDAIEECKGVTIFGKERWDKMKEEMAKSKT